MLVEDSSLNRFKLALLSGTKTKKVALVQTGPDDRIAIAWVDGLDFVSLHREYRSLLHAGGSEYDEAWDVDPEAGLTVLREHVPALIAALQAAMEES